MTSLSSGKLKLYFSRNPNRRLAVAVARHLGADVEFEFAARSLPDRPSCSGHSIRICRCPYSLARENDVARLPLDEYAAVHRWYLQLEDLDAWRDPFRMLDAPAMPPIPSGARPA
jgi:hypothetical protein